MNDKTCDPNAVRNDYNKGIKIDKKEKIRGDGEYNPFMPFNPFKQKNSMIVAKPLLGGAI